MSDEANIPGPSDPQNDDALAAEYVLGVLDQLERAEATTRLERDGDFARRVAEWESRLSDLNSEFTEIAPSPRVKAALDERLFARQVGNEADNYVRSGGLWASLTFWRSFSLATLAALVALAAVTLRPAEGPVSGDLLFATLSAEQSEEKFVALYDTASHELRVRHVAGNQHENQDFELWLIVGENAPVSLGLIGGPDNKTPVVEQNYHDQLTPGATLAVTLEPLGGSPTGAATGPIVAVGPVMILDTAKKI